MKDAAKPASAPSLPARINIEAESERAEAAARVAREAEERAEKERREREEQARARKKQELQQRANIIYESEAENKKRKETAERVSSPPAQWVFIFTALVVY